MRGLRTRTAAVALVVLVASACGGEAGRADDPSPNPSVSMSASAFATASASPSGEPVAREAVRFRATDGSRIDGTVFGDGEIAVVLAHQSNQDQSAWFFFAEELARQGYTAMTFTFRGYCPGGDGGCSEDGNAGGDGWMDVSGAVELLRRRGAERVFLTGASLGGSAVLRAAAEGVPADGVVSLSGVPVDAFEVTRGDLDGIRMPVLFVVGRFDGDLAGEMRRVFAKVPEPKQLVVLATGEHGTSLLRFADAGIQERVRELVAEMYGEP